MLRRQQSSEVAVAPQEELVKPVEKPVEKKRVKRRKSKEYKEREPDPSDSASDASVLDEETSFEKDVDVNAFASTRHGGEENCIEILREAVGARDVAVFKLKRDGVPLAGVGWLRVVRGAATVLGATITAGSRSMCISSAPLAPFAVTVVPTRHPAGRAVQTVESDWLQNACSELLSSPAVSKVRCIVNECIVMFAENCKPTDAVDGNEGETTSSDDSDIPSSCEFFMRRAGLPTCASGTLLVRGLSILGKNEKLPCFSLWKDWDGLTDKVSSFVDAATASDLRVLVCGGSGSGKSMAVRCLVNFLLSRHKEVVLIDTDVGQPEMNIPGLVAAHAVKRMRGGAPAASNRECPIAGGFFGDISPRENPDLYAACIRRVVAAGRAYGADYDCPVVINSDGWVSGIGASLLKLVSKCASPSHVISMTFAGHVDASRREGSSDVVGNVMREVQIDRSFGLVSPLPGRSSFYSGASLRDLHIATYFSAELERGRVRAVSLDELQVGTVGEPMERRLLIASLNASVVALAFTNGRKEKGQANVAEWNVLGCGIVRGVDAAKRMIYVTTPLGEAELERCNAVVLAAGIQVPSGLFLAMAEKAAPWVKPPYVTSNLVATGGQMKSRPSLHRGRR